ncbi:MAG: hypothetical protein RLO01_20360 [Thalassobaculaceae bacterium]
MSQHEPALRDRPKDPPGRDFDLKLRLIMRTLNAVTHKQMLGLLREVNPATGYTPDRAYKWVAGRAAPRDLSVYDDLARLLDLTLRGTPIRGTLLGALPFEDFYIAMRERYGDRVSRDLAPDALPDISGSSGPSGHGYATGAAPFPVPGHVLGSYLAISPAWSVHRRGDFVLGHVTVHHRNPHRVGIDYREALPGGDLMMAGTMHRAGRSLYAVVADQRSDDAISMVFALPSVPGVLLAGTMAGVPAHDAHPLPVASRIVCIDLAALRAGSPALGADGPVVPEPYCPATADGVRGLLEAVGAGADLAARLAGPVRDHLLDACAGGVLALDRAAVNAITGRLLA